MSPDGGFARAYRRRWEHPIFCSKQEAAVWAWMTDVAQWRACQVSTKFGPVALRSGELIIAERTISEEFGLHRNCVRKLIRRMVDDGMITLIRGRCPTTVGTIVSIVNYASYQDVGGRSEDGRDQLGTSLGPRIKKRKKSK